MGTPDERKIAIGDTTLHVETFGSAADPAVLLIEGMAASLLGWPGSLCAALAANGLFVIRYDQRDTGLSTHFPRGEPGYSVTDLAADAAAVLRELGVGPAHVVGHSLGAGVALVMLGEHADAVRSLVLMSVTTGDPDLPSGDADFPSLPDDLDAREQLVDYIVAGYRACDGKSPQFDAEAVRRFAAADVARSRDMGTTIVNHYQVAGTAPDGSQFAHVAVPTLVVHGEHDGLFPPAHGRAVQRVIAGSELVVLPGGGHDLLAHNHAEFIDAVTRHVRTVDAAPQG